MSDSALPPRDSLGTSLNNTSNDVSTITGVITHHTEGVVVDAINSFVVRLDSGESVAVLVMEAGRGRAFAGSENICDKNPQANEVFRTLSIGDEITVYGRRTEPNQLEVCSSDTFWIKKHG